MIDVQCNELTQSPQLGASVHDLFMKLTPHPAGHAPNREFAATRGN